MTRPIALALITAFASALPAAWADERPAYPRAPKAEVVDVYHGARVADPYRWLEDADHPDTVAWVEAQNRLTRSLLDGPERETIKKRLTELFDYPRVGVPEKQGKRYFYTRNTGQSFAKHRQRLFQTIAEQADRQRGLIAVRPALRRCRFEPHIAARHAQRRRQLGGEAIRRGPLGSREVVETG